MNPRFYFSTCQIGAEKAVKAEILQEFPQLRFAFSRPGFITFKEENNEGPVLSLTKGIFTRLWGEVLGQTKEQLKLPDLLAQIPKDAVIHCFDRDEFVPGDEPNAFIPHSRIQAILQDQTGFSWNGVPQFGSQVYDIIWIDDFHVFLGKHTHSESLSAFPGNIPEIPLSAESPSRAYLKIEEAFYRFKPIIEKGLHVLEIGCAPGGATTAMLNRGLLVTGVDPQFMDEKINKSPNFKFLRKPARFVTAEELASTNPDWLVMDMSIAPQDAITELTHIITLLRKNFGKSLKLRQGFLTLKLNDWKLASEIPLYLKRLEQLGFHGLHPIQLCSNRQEFFIWSSRFK